MTTQTSSRRTDPFAAPVGPDPAHPAHPAHLGRADARQEPAAARAVAVAVTDPDLAADVRAVLAALALDVAAEGTSPADVLVTDRPTDRRATGSRRVLRVGSDHDLDDHDRDDRDHYDSDRDDSDHDGGHNSDGVIRLPSGNSQLVAALAAPVPTRSGASVLVHGAVGGCGTSTLAAALAVRAAGSARTLLVETDPRGTGIDLLLGAESVPGLRLADVRADLGAPDPDALWDAVPKALPGLGVLARSRDRPVDAGDGAAGAVLAHRSVGGLVISDAGAAGAAVPGSAGADLVVVTRADLQGAVAAARWLRGAPGAVLVVRTGRGDPLHPVDVARFADAVRWHVLPDLGPVRRAAGAGELGTALSRGRPGRLRRLAEVAEAVLAEGGLDG